jgi:hypothetical protein
LSLHKLLERHAICRLLKDDSAEARRRTSRATPVGFFHIGIAGMRCGGLAERQVERMNRAIKDATMRTVHYASASVPKQQIMHSCSLALRPKIEDAQGQHTRRIYPPPVDDRARALQAEATSSQLEPSNGKAGLVDGAAALQQLGLIPTVWRRHSSRR